MGERCYKGGHKLSSCTRGFNLKKPSCTRSQFLTAVLLKVQVFRDVTPSLFVNSYRRFEGSCALIFKA